MKKEKILFGTPEEVADGLIALNHATSVAGAANAADQITSPVQNLLVADTSHIGFYTTGRVPIRKAGDGTYPVDGADGGHDWLSIVTSEKLPRAIDPPSGELINANNPTVDASFPVFIARDTYGDWRARRIKALLASIMGIEAQHVSVLLAVQALLMAGAPQLISLSPGTAAMLPAAAGSVGFPNAFYKTNSAAPAGQGAVK